ncbi:hypothetical protein KIN20_004137 [Parelaphostrongylus tenuis]|uniref:Uncharacterized protein n=1 Tax=Parelaphostrongylus tenuis TaxID=148309 RepID=A0AAD5M2L3_PARTN|nr:hypothetical protein KIN20_004137 [Parelaphostrongylus tenuis]
MIEEMQLLCRETSRVVRMKALVGTEMQEARHFRTKAQMPPSGTAAQATGATPLAYQRGPQWDTPHLS